LSCKVLPAREYRYHAHTSHELFDPTLMQLRLWPRLFIAFAALSISALLAFGLLQQNNFQRGFLDYLNRLSLERLNEPAQQLGVRYTQQGNWRFAEGNERELLSALGLAAEQANLNQAPPPRINENDFRRPPPPRDQNDFRPPPPRDRALEFADQQQEQRRPPRRPAGPLDLAERLLLLDADGNKVNGNPEVSRQSPFIIIKSEGHIVGKLLLQPLPGLRGGIDVAFANNQIKHAGIAALIVLIGALLAAWVLSRWLLAPIRALGQGVRKLAAGEYSTRLPTERTDELGELAIDFNHMANTFEAHQKLRQQWGADIAHELRTPLSILRGEIQALQDGIRQPNPETLASLQNECGRMESLVEDLYQLTLSDAGALSYRFEILDLADLLHEASNAQQDTMRNAGLELQLILSPKHSMLVRADRQRLAQLFGNLLSNSLRYTDAPGRMTIKATRLNKFWQINIEDTAPGVPTESLERIFDRLYRVEPSRSRAFGGAGLGLSICRNIVTAHNGTIRAETSTLGGLLIHIQLHIHEN
jgi:two-component system, OmpR family, sensor histidine kinase BaeS